MLLIDDVRCLFSPFGFFPSISLLTRFAEYLAGSRVSDLYHRLSRSTREGAPEADEESIFSLFLR